MRISLATVLMDAGQTDPSTLGSGDDASPKDLVSDRLQRYSIGEKLKKLRGEKKLGLVELGKHTGLSAALLSKLERGKLYPTLPTLVRISTVFNVGLDYCVSSTMPATSSSSAPRSGKTHVSVARAESAIRAGFGAYFITAHDLVTDLARAMRENCLERRLRVYLAPKLLVIDEMGYLPLDEMGATIFFQLISARYERGSVIVTSNKSYGDWGSIFGDTIIATAILDRLLHHSTTVNIRGESYRLKERRRAGLIGGQEQQEGHAVGLSLAPASVPPKARQKRALGSAPASASENTL